MNFESEKHAKHHVMALLARVLSPAEAHQRTVEYDSYLANALGSPDEDFWRNQVAEHKRWIESEEFQSGAYPQGIDSDFLELVEWRAEIAAFVETPTENQPFERYEFFARWNAGANYAVFSLLGRLVSRDSRDNSLSNAWNLATPYLRTQSLISNAELAILDTTMDRSRGRFRNEASPAFRFRNKSVAHNEATPRITWESVDADIQALARIWAILTIWSEGPVLLPFRESAQVFLGLDRFYSATEISELCTRRDRYIARLKTWCVTNAATNEVETNRSPFATMALSILPLSGQ